VLGLFLLERHELLVQAADPLVVQAQAWPQGVQLLRVPLQVLLQASLVLEALFTDVTGERVGALMHSARVPLKQRGCAKRLLTLGAEVLGRSNVVPGACCGKWLCCAACASHGARRK